MNRWLLLYEAFVGFIILFFSPVSMSFLLLKYNLVYSRALCCLYTHRTGLERIQTDPGEFLSIIPEKTQFFLSFPIILAVVTLTVVVLIWTQEGTRIPFRELQLCHKKKEERISGKSAQTGLLFNHFDFTFENLETLRNVERGSAFAA